MSIVIELSPEEESELRRIAAAAHLDLTSYATQYFRRLVQNAALAKDSPVVPEIDLSTDYAEERIRLLRDDIQKLGIKDAPFYPDEVMTREWIYGDHP